MFSMFGRTGAPQKRGPHKRSGKFLQHSNMSEIIVDDDITVNARVV